MELFSCPQDGPLLDTVLQEIGTVFFQKAPLIVYCVGWILGVLLNLFHAAIRKYLRPKGIKPADPKKYLVLGGYCYHRKNNFQVVLS